MNSNWILCWEISRSILNFEITYELSSIKSKPYALNISSNSHLIHLVNTHEHKLCNVSIKTQLLNDLYTLFFSCISCCIFFISKFQFCSVFAHLSFTFPQPFFFRWFCSCRSAHQGRRLQRGRSRKGQGHDPWILGHAIDQGHNENGRLVHGPLSYHRKRRSEEAATFGL